MVHLKNCAFCETPIAPVMHVCAQHMIIEYDNRKIHYDEYKKELWFRALVEAELIQYKEEKTKITLAYQNTKTRRVQSQERRAKVLAMFYDAKRPYKEIAYLLDMKIKTVRKIVERHRKRKSTT